MDNYFESLLLAIDSDGVLVLGNDLNDEYHEVTAVRSVKSLDGDTIVYFTIL